MTAVHTDFGDVRESARRIRVEKDNFVILTTNVQTSLQQIVAAIGGGTPGSRDPAFGSNIPILTTDVEVGISTLSGPVTCALPSAAAWQAANPGGLELTMFDRTGNAATNNISFTLNGGDTFNYAVTPKVTTAFGLLKLRPYQNPATGWYIRGIN